MFVVRNVQCKECSLQGMIIVRNIHCIEISMENRSLKLVGDAGFAG